MTGDSELAGSAPYSDPELELRGALAKESLPTLDGTGDTGALVRGQRRRRLWPYVTVGAVLGAVKGDALHVVLQQRVGVMVLLGVALALSVLRPKPINMAMSAAALVALALHPHALVLGVVFAVGVFVLIMTLFTAVAAVLHARQSGRT